MTTELADRVAAAVLGCSGVAGLAEGPLATYLPGRTVPGVAVRPEGIEIAVVARYGQPLHPLAGRIRRVVHRVAPDHPISVHIADIA